MGSKRQPQCFDLALRHIWNLWAPILNNIFDFFYGTLFFNKCHIKSRNATFFYHRQCSSGLRNSCPRLANSDKIVFFRSLWLAGWIFLIALIFNIATDPAVDYASVTKLDYYRGMVNKTIPWFGGIWGALYFFRYQQYSAQYLHLTQMYNSIRSAEIKMHAGGVGKPDKQSALWPKAHNEAYKSLARWKAGFIELAEELHLATRLPFISIIKTWGEDDSLNVRGVFDKHFPGGATRFDCLMLEINSRMNNLKNEYGSCSPLVKEYIKKTRKDQEKE